MRDIFCTLFLVMFGAFLILSNHEQQFTMSIGSHTLSVGIQHSTDELEARVVELEAAQAEQTVEYDDDEEEVEDVCNMETTCCASDDVQMSCAFNDDEDAEEG